MSARLSSLARLLFLVCGVVAWAAPVVRAEDAVPPWRARYLAVLRACRAHADAECRDSLAALLASMPGHPGPVYTAARVAAGLGDRAGALSALGVLADMGLGVDIARDSAFVTLWSDPEFAAVARRNAANHEPIRRATFFHRFADPDLLVEDVAYDAKTRRWLVSSIHERKIVAVDRGREKDFVSDGLWGVFALGIDARRRRLWATTSATAEMKGGAGADEGRSAVLCYDLDSGRLLRRVEIARHDDQHVLGDLTVGPDGSAYVTDSKGGGVYRAKVDADALETLLAPGSLNSPQSPVLWWERGWLLIADYSRGIAALDLKTRRLTWLDQPRDLAAAGIDGLYRFGSRLVAIQNGIDPHRVVMLDLDPARAAITGWRVLERGSPDLGEPNHGTIVGTEMTLIGNSGWDRVGDGGKLASNAATKPAVLLRLQLGTKRRGP